MDERTFQEELRQLKLRLAQLTADSQRRLIREDPRNNEFSVSNGYHNYVFTSQADYLNSGLASGTRDGPAPHRLPTMFSTPQGSDNLPGYSTEERLQRLLDSGASLSPSTQPQHQAARSLFPPTASMLYGSGIDQSSFPVHHNNMTIPSGPVFWQLISALKMDVRQIDGRVAKLEQSFEDLEERVEALEPSKFTPEGSVESDGGGYVKVEDSDDSGAEVLSESHSPRLDDDLGRVLHDDARHALRSFSDLPWSNDRVRCELTNPRVPLPPSQLRAMQTLDDIPCLSESPTVTQEIRADLPSGVNFRDREIAKLDDLLRDATETNRSQEELLTAKDDKIANLELRLRNSQTTAATWEIIAHELQDELAERKQQIDESYNESTTLHAQLSAKCTELSDLTAHYEENLDHQNEQYNEYTESCRLGEEQLQQHNMSLEQSLKARDDYIVSLEYAAEAQSNDIGALQQAQEAYEDQIASLSAFCEQKDAIFHQQQAIIARGREMLESRDADHDANRVRAEDAEASLQRHRARHEELVSVLAQRHAEIAALKAQQVREENVNRSRDAHVEMLRCENDKLRHEVAGLKNVIRDGKTSRRQDAEHGQGSDSPAPPGSTGREHARKPSDPDQVHAEVIDDLARAMSETPHSAQPTEPFAHAVKIMRDGTRRREIPSWAPRSIRGYSRLPHEEARAQVWALNEQEGPKQRPQHQFGVASPLNSRQSTGSARRREDRREDAPTRSRGHRDDSYRHRASRHMYGRSDDPSADEGSSERPSRRKLPLDATLLPPLPAPVEPARMESMPNLRASTHERRSRADRHSGLSRHASMAEMPKRRLQAYVETEEEGEGGRGRDGSLLD
ncbi:hypothetical protein B0A48_02286 [Cryoendolithus antarcticus]|uniref:Uncharacterized protein n=1 Tax=Cryoendolithus antarcticus TaxID=1507870 RepID=A0A1V8TNP5_9PEZI|nr:hypothetical protein B0A48_02286 [Cryoendolithus antarcticus]